MTPAQASVTDINWHNFEVAKKLAVRAGATTVMLTGKGEPTLKADEVRLYLEKLRDHFPLIELQTNGLHAADNVRNKTTHSWYELWYETGLTTIALSIAHWEQEKNQKIFCREGAKHFDLKELVEWLHHLGLSVRLSCVLLKDLVCDSDSVGQLINWARAWGVEQLTLTPVSKPSATRNPEVSKWVKENRLSPRDVDDIHVFLEQEGTVLMELAHGALVYDVHGQNVCLSNCLLHSPLQDGGLIRNLIFYPDGHIRYDWAHEGAVIL